MKYFKPLEIEAFLLPIESYRRKAKKGLQRLTEACRYIIKENQ